MLRFALFASVLLWALSVMPSCSEPETTFVCDADDDECLADLLCGNLELDEGEECDNSDEYCARDCSESLGRCGDGLVQTDFGEQCDGGGSAGGAGGAPEFSLEGCSQQCRAKNGYVCDEEENSCGQTGVDSEEVAAEHPEEVCTWIVGLMGGPYTGTHCQVNGRIQDHVAPEVNVCVANLNLDDQCTIGEFEEWARDQDRCDIFLKKSPCED